MARWHNVRIRNDLYELVAKRAAADARSVAQMTDRLLTGALEQGTGERATSAENPAAEGVPGASGVAAPSPARTPLSESIELLAPAEPPRIAQGHRRQVIEGQTTVDEMLASCPQCAGRFVEHDAGGGGGTMVLCEDCGFVRESEGT